MTNKIRHQLSMCIVFILTLVVAYYYALSPLYLMPLAALFVMQTSLGSAFYQGMKKLFLIAIVVSVLALLIQSMPFFYKTMHDVAMGGALGILGNIFIFPRRVDMAFREIVTPIIKTYQDYFLMIIDTILQDKKKISSNQAMELQLLAMPKWVFETGFDKGLQAGYQFFLIKLTQMSDVLFGMHYLARFSYDNALINSIESPMRECTDKISQFLSTLMTVIESGKMGDLNDFEKEIAILEKQFRQTVPLSIELLDMKREYVNLANFIYYLSDLRKLLFRSIESLPTLSKS